MPAKSLQDVRREYEVWHAQNATVPRLESDLDAPWYAWVRRSLPPLEGRFVLEVACGRGALVGWMAARGARAVGCDISETALRNARRTAGTFLAGDIHQLCFPENSFDIIVCCETLEHTLAPDQAIRELVRVARPGATVLLTTPSYLNTYGLYRIYLRLRGRPFGVHGIQPIDHAFFSISLLGRLRRAGLRIRQTDGFGHYVRPARDRLAFIDRLGALRQMLKHFALHFAVQAEVIKPA